MDCGHSALDYAFINGSVITMNDANEIVAAAGVRGNRIACVGTADEVLRCAGSRTEIIDLSGRSLIPGLIDTHFHPILSGLFGTTPDASIINTGYEQCKSVADILKLVREAVKTRRPGDWISMMGYDQNRLLEKRHVTLSELDEAAPDNPEQCMRTCGHICVYNSKAYETIGVFEPADALKYPKNEIVVEAEKLTGLTKDHTHFLLWSKVDYPEEAQIEAAMRANDVLLQNGITSIHDPGEFDAPSFRIMQRLCRERKFKPREYMMLHSVCGKPVSKLAVERFLSLGLLTGIGDAFFRVGSCKFMIDGGTSGPSCATREPYDHDPDMPGILGWERDEVAAYLQWIHDSGCQATAHAVGDLAVEFMVEGYEKALAKNPRKDARHRIEHCSIVDADLIERIASLDLCPSMNPGFIAWNGANYEKYFGNRMEFFTALRGMIDAGIRASIGSDAPSGPAESAMILDAAVNRIDRTCGKIVDRTQAVSLMEALRLYTINGAYASFEEKEKGSIENGKLADLVILSADTVMLSPDRIPDLKVDLTMIDGIVEYKRKI